jgi:hypothetical protein
MNNLPTLLGQQDFHAEHSDMLAAARDGLTIDPKARELNLVSGQGQTCHCDGRPSASWRDLREGAAYGSCHGHDARAKLQAQEERRRQSDYLLWCKCKTRDPESAAARRDYDREAAIEGQPIPNVSVTEAIKAALAPWRGGEHPLISRLRKKSENT